MVPAGNKAKRLSSVKHTTKTIHHHQGFDKIITIFQKATKSIEESRHKPKSMYQYLMPIR